MGLGSLQMTTKPKSLQRPDVHFDAILSLVGLLLGFLFVVVIYILEFHHEFLTTWGMPLIMFLAVTYAIGLIIIGSIISHEINFYLAKKTLELEPAEFPVEHFTQLQQKMQRALRRTLQMLLYFIFSFGLFLINLACFTASKFFYPTFAVFEDSITLIWGPLGVVFIRLLGMFLVQLILIIPFAKFQGGLWDSYKIVENLQNDGKNPEE
jgi:tetrahydromethanopterin S-methyltransferase subunit E